MPDPALPRARFLPGQTIYVRHYVDALRRPMEGEVTLTPRGTHAIDDHVVVAAPVTVSLQLGSLQIALLPGVYRVRAQLKTVDGTLLVHEDEVTVAA